SGDDPHPVAGRGNQPRRRAHRPGAAILQEPARERAGAGSSLPACRDGVGAYLRSLPGALAMGRRDALTRRTFLKTATAGALGAALSEGAIRPTAAQPTTDLTMLTVAQLAAVIAARVVSPVEVVDALLARIDRRDPRRGAAVPLVPDRAREAARQAEQEIMRGEYRGPLHGIPFGVKDTHYTAGIRTTARTPALADFVPDFGATVVVRLKEAGGSLMGRIDTPEWAFGGATRGPKT